MKEQLKPLVDPELHSLLNFPAADFDKMWLVKLARIYGRIDWWRSKADKSLSITKISLNNASTQFTLEYFENTKLSGKRPCLVYYHGGAFILPAFGYFKKIFSRYALEAGCDIAFVDYSLAPEAKSKEILGQCDVALKWVMDNAERLNVDSSKIALGGDSAGGCLASSMAHMAFDKYGPDAICGQLIIYPAIDDSCSAASIKELYNCPVWSGEACESMWPAYIDPADSSYAVPIKRESLQGLPPAYLETAQYDPMRDEGKAYAARLQEAGVEIMENHTEKTVHGYDSDPSTHIAKINIDKRVEALKSFFN